VNLTIEKMIYGGDGLARLPNGKAVFMPFVVDGEEVSATIVEEKTGFARARVTEILKPSANRVVPCCPYFENCGGCHYQHADYAAQLEIKRSVLRDTLRRTAKIDWQEEIVTHSAEPWHYRNRTRLKVRGGSDFAAGYYRMGSHELLAVEQCPISSPLINRAISEFWQMGRAQHVPVGIAEIELFADHLDSNLLLEVYGELDSASAQKFLEDLRAGISATRGVALFVQGTGGIRRAASVGEPFLGYLSGGKSFRVSAGSFFQVNRYLIDELVKVVTADARGKTALDLYAGVGLFANHLAANFEQVIAVESAPTSVADLEANAVPNVSAVRSSTEQFLQRSQKLRTDLLVVDPPRAGLGGRTTKLLAAAGTPRIVYLSCDPATLARDLRTLLESGYRIERVHLFDLFPQTFHIETMVRLAR